MGEVTRCVLVMPIGAPVEGEADACGAHRCRRRLALHFLVADERGKYQLRANAAARAAVSVARRSVRSKADSVKP